MGSLKCLDWSVSRWLLLASGMVIWGDQTPYMMVQDSEGKILCDSRTETPHLDGRSIAQ